MLHQFLPGLCRYSAVETEGIIPLSTPVVRRANTHRMAGSELALRKPAWWINLELSLMV